VQKPGRRRWQKSILPNDKRRIEMQAASGDDTIMAKLDRTTVAGQVVHLSIGGGGDTIILDLAAHTSAVLVAYPKNVCPGERR
jgi:hypothetical protein